MSDPSRKPTDRFIVRAARPGDRPGAYYICLKTGDNGQDGEPYYQEDPDALGRVFVGPYLEFEPDHCLMLEDESGLCGYAMGALDSRRFYERYEREWRPKLCAEFPEPQGDPALWTRVQHMHFAYHHPNYFLPPSYEMHPSHLHIDLLPRAQGQGQGRLLLTRVLRSLESKGSPGAHLGLSVYNMRAHGFYQRLGFSELTRAGAGPDACIYMGITFPIHER